MAAISNNLWLLSTTHVMCRRRLVSGRRHVPRPSNESTRHARLLRHARRSMISWQRFVPLLLKRFSNRFNCWKVSAVCLSVCLASERTVFVTCIYTRYPSWKKHAGLILSKSPIVSRCPLPSSPPPPPPPPPLHPFPTPCALRNCTRCRRQCVPKS